MIFSGVFECHPRLILAIVEFELAWAPHLLSTIYQNIGRTAGDLPYTPHFESLYSSYTRDAQDDKPTRQEVWRHLLNMRKAGQLPKLGPAKSKPPYATTLRSRRP